MQYRKSGPTDQRTMPICFNSDKLKILEKYAKTNGMLNYSQALEDLIKRTLQK